MVAVRRQLVAAEIARLYGRSQNTIQNNWMRHPDFPTPTGKRGRWNTYDAEQVHAFALDYLLQTEPDGDPTDLLTIAEIADYTGWAEATIRSDISRSRWRAPDSETDGVKRWRRATVDEIRASRRAYRKSDIRDE